jgi:dephospho-CoA kinase
MKKIVLTGNIGSGKSLALSVFEMCGDAIFSADNIINDIYQNDADFFRIIKNQYPDFIVQGTISKAKISEYLKKNPDFLSVLEGILYPILQQKRQEFIAKSLENKVKIAVFEIPLFFEKHSYFNPQDYDKILLLYAPPNVRWNRVKNRPLISLDKFNFLNKQQISPEQVTGDNVVKINSDNNLEDFKQKILEFREHLL